MPDQAPASEAARRRVSRRAFLGVAAGGAAAIGIGGLAAVGALDVGALTGNAAEQPASGQRTYPFAGPHQAGIVTPAQDRMYTAAFDLTTTSRDELIDL